MDRAKQALEKIGAKNIRARPDRHWIGDLVCPRCKKIRSVYGSTIFRKGGEAPLCGICNGQTQPRNTGEKHHWFKRGFYDVGEYVFRTLPKSHPFREMGSGENGSIAIHRLVVAESLGRFLESWEHVHHKNGDTKDNRIENLELLTADIHIIVTQLVQENAELKREVAGLRKSLDNLDALTDGDMQPENLKIK